MDPPARTKESPARRDHFVSRPRRLDQQLGRRDPAAAAARVDDCGSGAGQFWLLLGCATFDCAWLAAWLLVAMHFHSSLAIILASFPVLKWLLLLVARQPAENQQLDQSKRTTAVTERSGVFQATSRHGAA